MNLGIDASSPTDHKLVGEVCETVFKTFASMSEEHQRPGVLCSALLRVFAVLIARCTSPDRDAQTVTSIQQYFPPAIAEAREVLKALEREHSEARP